MVTLYIKTKIILRYLHLSGLTDHKARDNNIPNRNLIRLSTSLAIS